MTQLSTDLEEGEEMLASDIVGLRRLESTEEPPLENQTVWIEMNLRASYFKEKVTQKE